MQELKEKMETTMLLDIHRTTLKIPPFITCCAEVSHGKQVLSSQGLRCRVQGSGHRACVPAVGFKGVELQVYALGFRVNVKVIVPKTERCLPSFGCLLSHNENRSLLSYATTRHCSHGRFSFLFTPNTAPRP